MTSYKSIFFLEHETNDLLRESELLERRSMIRKLFVIDTNVLLHDPYAMKEFKDSDVIIPMEVLEELDRIKRQPDEMGKNARTFVRYMDSLKDKGSLHTGVRIENDILIRVHIESVSKKTFPLSMDRNKILLAAYQLQETHKALVLVSKDFVMRIKAEALGIEAEDYEKGKESYDKIYRGYRKIEVDKEQIDLFYKQGFLDYEASFCPNEYCLLFAEQSSAVGKYHALHQRIEPLIKITKDVWGIQPLNMEQRCALDLLLRDDIKLVSLVGQAGTGKTLLALAAALHKVFDDPAYHRILVSRPIMPLGKDIGYLPGTKEEKLFSWMQPIYDNLEFLCQSMGGASRGRETQEWIMESKKIEMEAVTYIRGRTLPKMFIIIDEAQNLTPHEVKTVISRAGKDTKVVLTGDPTQIDNPYLDKDSNALTFLVHRFRQQALFGHILLEKTERSELAALAADIL